MTLTFDLISKNGVVTKSLRCIREYATSEYEILIFHAELQDPNQWCGRRPSVLGQDRSETKKSVLVMHTVVLVLDLVLQV